MELRAEAPAIVVLRIHQKLSKLKAKNRNAAVIAIDQSAAFDLIPHDLLGKKLEHIGIDKESVQMILNYLKDRKQVVHINGNNSDKLVTGPYSVSQGSVVSGLFYLISVLDAHHQSHCYKHNTHKEYIHCQNTEINIYVDDVYGIVVENKDRKIPDLWKDIDEFIRKMELYYNSNGLSINVSKTQMVVYSKIVTFIHEKNQHL